MAYNNQRKQSATKRACCQQLLLLDRLRVLPSIRIRSESSSFNAYSMLQSTQVSSTTFNATVEDEFAYSEFLIRLRHTALYKSVLTEID